MQAVHCDNCGARLYPGQRFCRSCGQATAQLSDENVPTQIMPPAGARNTADSGAAGPQTSPVYTPATTYYQPPGTPAPYPYPTRQRSPWGWIIALASIFLFAFVFLAVMIGVRSARREAPRASASVPLAGGGNTLGESGSASPIVESIPLREGGTFSLQAPTGDVLIEGWDEPRAQVKVTKTGGSERDREALEVKYTGDETTLSLTAHRPSGSNVRIRYEIRLPRRLARLTILGVSTNVALSDLNAPVVVKTESGSIRIEDLRGEISVETQSGSVQIEEATGRIKANTTSGSIRLADITGSASAASISGSIRAVFESVHSGEPLEFKSTSGSIDLQFKDVLNADLDARTVTGRIELESIDVETERRVVGQSAHGKIGDGGQPLKVNSIAGRIKIAKRP